MDDPIAKDLKDGILYRDGTSFAQEILLAKLLEALVRKGVFDYSDLQMLFAGVPNASEKWLADLPEGQKPFSDGFCAEQTRLQSELLPRLLKLLPPQQQTKKDA